MATNSEVDTVRRTADQITKSSPSELASLLASPDDSIDTSDIPEHASERQRLRRDDNGRLPRRRSVFREAVVAEMKVQGVSAYALCKEARQHCPTISETAVGEFLKGQRSIGIDYLEAILLALNITLNLPSVPPVIEPVYLAGELTADERTWLREYRSARSPGNSAAEVVFLDPKERLSSEEVGELLELKRRAYAPTEPNGRIARVNAAGMRVVIMTKRVP